MDQTSKSSIDAFFGADNVNTLPSIQVEDPSDGSKHVPRMKKIFQHTCESKLNRSIKKKNNNQYSMADLSSLIDMSGSLTYSPSRSRSRGGTRSRSDGRRRGGLTGLSVGLGFSIPTTLMIDRKTSKAAFARIDPSNETKKRVYVDDPILAELRTYLNSMDEYKATSFTIWGGKTLRNTPEFTSYHENHIADWGSISTIINSLEKIMQKFDVPLAIINGDTVAALAGLALPRIDKEQLLNCCSNRDTVEAAFTSMRNANDHNQQFRAAILLQSLLRRWKAMRYYREEKERRDAAMKIQLRYRYHYYRNKLVHQRAARDLKIQLEIEEGIIKLQKSWGSKNLHPSFLVIIPCITVPDFIQKGTKYFHELHALYTLFISQLARPNCEICFVLPDHLNDHEMQRLELFLNTLVDPSDRHTGVDDIRKRLHFVIPELGMVLPKAAKAASQMTLSDLLWYSPGALRRIRRLCSRHPGSVLLPAGGIANLTHERIASYLNISLLAPNPHLSSKLASRSIHKKVFEEANISFPPGAHSINTQDDLIKALARLIAANMNVRRWNIRLNTDIDNETLLWFEPLKLNIFDVINTEMKKILKLNDNNVNAWYSRPVQLSARKRISIELLEKIEEFIHIDRKDLFPSWIHFLRKLKKFGGVVEADAEHFKLGNISNSFFIAPNGDLMIEEGLDKITDSTFESTQAYLYPSVLASSNALKKVTKAIANALYYNYQAVGYFNVTFVSYFDVWEHCPRLWALDLHVGLSCASGALGCLQVISSHAPKLGAADDVVKNIKHKNMDHVINENIIDGNYNNNGGTNANTTTITTTTSTTTIATAGNNQTNDIVSQFPGPLDIVIPDPPHLHVMEDRLFPQKYVLNPEMHFHGARSMLYIPLIFHSPLQNEDEDMFYRLIAKRGIVFNLAMRIGVLIMHIGPLEKGMIGILCIHETRIRTLELAIQALISIYELIGGEEKIIEENKHENENDDNNSNHSNKHNMTSKNKQQSITTIGTVTSVDNSTTTLNGNTNSYKFDKKLRSFEGIRLIRILGNLKTIMRHDISIKHSKSKNSINIDTNLKTDIETKIEQK